MKSQEQLDATPDVKSGSDHESKEKGGADLHSTESNGEGIVIEETTHRGLKARHAQMIALGGTIGTRDTFNHILHIRTNTSQVLGSLLEVVQLLPKEDLYLSSLVIQSWLSVYWVLSQPLLKLLHIFLSVVAQ